MQVIPGALSGMSPPMPTMSGSIWERMVGLRRRARHLLAGEQYLGNHIRIGGSYFEVVGIIASYGDDTGTLQTPDQLIDAYIPLSSMQERYGDVTVRRAAGSRVREKVELHQIIVQVDDISNVEKTAAGIESMLGKFHGQTDYRLQVPLALLR